MNTKNIIFLLVFIAAACLSKAQYIAAPTLSAGYQCGNSNSALVSYTVGEMALFGKSNQQNSISNAFMQSITIVESKTEPPKPKETPPESQGECNVYPNPTKALVFISLKKTKKEAGKVRICIFDMTGRKWKESEFFTDEIITLDIASFPKGQYLIRVYQQNNTSDVYRIVKM